MLFTMQIEFLKIDQTLFANLQEIITVFMQQKREILIYVVKNRFKAVQIRRLQKIFQSFLEIFWIPDRLPNAKQFFLLSAIHKKDLIFSFCFEKIKRFVAQVDKMPCISATEATDDLLDSPFIKDLRHKRRQTFR